MKPEDGFRERLKSGKMIIKIISWIDEVILDHKYRSLCVWIDKQEAKGKFK